MKILWTEEAIRRIKDIFDYYSEKASPNLAKKIVNGIIEYVDILIKHPDIGPREELLKNRKKSYHYLVHNNYKIIYWKENSIIFIASVFDTGQNPKKLKDRIK